MTCSNEAFTKGIGDTGDYEQSAWWSGTADGRRLLEAGARDTVRGARCDLAQGGGGQSHHRPFIRSALFGDSIEAALRRIVREELEAERRTLVKELLSGLDDHLQAKDDALLTVEQVAELLQIDQHTVYRWIKGGKLAAVSAGRARRVRKSAVETFLEGEKRTRPAPEVEEAAATALRKMAAKRKGGR